MRWCTFSWRQAAPEGTDREKSLETIKGYVDHIIYQNKENGYAVLSLIADGDEEICVGNFRGVDNGENLEITGEYVEHPSYGFQFKAGSFRVVEPDDLLSMERYLGSGAIKGVGEALAKRIVKKFGEDTFRIVEEEPERLVEVKGISERIARQIAEQFVEKKEIREAFIFLQKYGITNTLAVRIYEQYGIGLYKVLQENPYRLAEDIHGVGFRLADEIAGKIGIHTDSDYRIRSGVLYVLMQASAEGHLFLPMERLIQRGTELLGVPAEAVRSQVENLAMDRKVVIKKTKDVQAVYAYSAYYAELNCARMLHELNVVMEAELLSSEENRIQEILKRILTEQGLELDELQKNAVFECVKHAVMILSGGPGTGKTTTINTIIRYFDEEGMDILLAAPTGRAAKRMTETTGYEARTIHRMLEINGGMEDASRPFFERNEDNPLEADVIIIDEMSMVDIYLFQSLLSAISVGTRLILVGDVDQLPSVGPGQILRDVIDSRCFSTVMLKNIYRQAGESDIVMNAHRINEGQSIPFDNKSRDFFFLRRNDVQVIYKHMIQLITEKLPKYVDAQPYDIQVLTPMRKGSLGVETLNEILQRYLNPPDPAKREHSMGERIFREGDKVMQIKNNYQLEWEIVSKYGICIDRGMGVFNGDIGTIRKIREEASTVQVEFDENRLVEYPFSRLEELELAYAITIHKSQGSEYPAVLLPLLSGPRMLMNRNLLYTGVTRARKCVTILGSRETVEEMIGNENQYHRYTGLCQRILEMEGEEQAW